MKTIYDKYDKEKIANLPRATFDGRIFTIISEKDADRAVDFLLSQPVIGLDTETRPSFKRGRFYLVSLLQVSTPDVCFLFRLNRTGITDSLVRLLEDTTITKIGLSWQDDLRSLMHRRQFTPGTFVEIQQEVKRLGIVDMSLQKIYANLFEQKISKTQQLSNWEADSLSEAQQLYASTDAWACIRIYEEIQRLADSGDYTLEIKPLTPEEIARAEAAAAKAKENPDEKKEKKRRWTRKKKTVKVVAGESLPTAAAD